MDYPSIAENADAGVVDAGGPVILVQPGASPYVPGQGTAQQPDTEHPCTGAIFDFSLEKVGMAFSPGTLIQAGDRWLILSPKGVPASFAPGWRATTFPDMPEAVETYTVAAVKRTGPAGIPVLYEALVRK